MAASIKVFIGVPSNGLWTAKFGVALCATMIDFLLNGTGDVVVDSKEGSLLPDSRHQLVRTAQKHKATHILFVDTDQTFPANTLRRLVSHKKEVVACNIATKREPSSPTARLKDPRSDRGLILYTFPDRSGLQEVWRIGTGIMLVDLAVFGRMTPPWFTVKYKANADSYQGEDWGLCEQLELHGIPVYVDHGLSWEVKHLGSKAYGMDEVELKIPEEMWEKMQHAKATRTQTKGPGEVTCERGEVEAPAGRVS